jgi:hypothetical protein
MIVGHEAVHAREMGWQELSNGELLKAAAEAGFGAIVTTDKNVRHQQNMPKKAVALITLNPHLTELEFIAPLAERLCSLLNAGIAPGTSLVIGPDAT